MEQNNEVKFYQALEDIFIGANIEGEGGYINLLKIKSSFYKKIIAVFKEELIIRIYYKIKILKKNFLKDCFLFLKNILVKVEVCIL